MKIHSLLAVSAAVTFACAAQAQVSIDKYTSLSNEQILKPADGDWPSWRRTVDNQAYSPLEQVNTKNVKQLDLAWAWSMPVGGLQETAPLVHDGIMFLG